MYKQKRTLDELLGQTCEACDQWFETMQGLMAHQSMSRKCSWYKRGKLKAVFKPDLEKQASSSSEFTRAQRAQKTAISGGSRCAIDMLFRFRKGVLNISSDASTSGSSGGQGDDVEDGGDLVVGQDEDVELEDLQEQDEDEDRFYEDLAFVQVPISTTSSSQPRAGPSRHTKRRTAIQLDDEEDTRVEDVDGSAGEVIGRRETVREDWRKHFAEQADEKRDTAGKRKGTSRYN